MIRLVPPPRGTDPWGSGHYGASRGKRIHLGVDLAAQPESVLLSPVKGTVTKLGYPYSDDLSYRYVEITTTNGDRHRFFYVEPLVVKGQKVKVDDSIGIVQDIRTRYAGGMTPHIHYEIKDDQGTYLDPGNRI